MRYRDSILGNLLKPVLRERFKGIVAVHHGDAYDKTFDSWDHLVTLVFAQLAPVDSLRGLVAAWNANAHHHYHLGCRAIARSTLSDANHRRPPAVFADTFAMLCGLASRSVRREGAAMLRLMDATPIPLHKLCGWAQWNGRTHGLKMHVTFDPLTGCLHRAVITPSTVNDIAVGRTQPLEAGAIYVFDKAFCDYRWWTRLHEAGAVFVTRPKRNVRYEIVGRRPVGTQSGDGFTILDDADIGLTTQGKARLSCPIRRVRIQRDDGTTLDVITNDQKRPAVEIAALYKARWEIELLFRWVKQHLKLTRFLGRSENAIRLQLLAAMIAYVLLVLARKASRSILSLLRFAELAGQCLFIRKPLAHLDKPPEVNPSRPKSQRHPDQLEIVYA